MVLLPHGKVGNVLGSPARNMELDSMGPFQLELFYDSQVV